MLYYLCILAYCWLYTPVNSVFRNSFLFNSTVKLSFQYITSIVSCSHAFSQWLHSKQALCWAHTLPITLFCPFDLNICQLNLPWSDCPVPEIDEIHLPDLWPCCSLNFLTTSRCGVLVVLDVSVDVELNINFRTLQCQRYVISYINTVLRESSA